MLRKAILTGLVVMLSFGISPCLVSQAQASSVGVYFDQFASDCDWTQPPFTPVTWYVLAVLGGDAAAPGIRGAGCRVTGPPAEWFHIPNANPVAILLIGDPLGSMGAEMVFPTCNAGTGGVVLLFSITSFSTSAIDNLVYQVVAASTPNFVGFDFPGLVLCDEPTFTKICVPGTAARINGGICAFPDVAPSAVCPPLGVRAGTWGHVKSLYGE